MGLSETHSFSPTSNPAVSPTIRIGLSTASVFPQKTEAAFAFAAELGYDGIELMVWAESVSQDIKAIKALSKKYGIPVLSVHAPCLLISQRVWGRDPVFKLTRSVQAAEELDASAVIVHPPFRWQRRYAEGFSDQISQLEASSGIVVAVENMFPIRADRFFGKYNRSAERMRNRGGSPGAGFSTFYPSHDPTVGNYPHYTLDLSHTATAGVDAQKLAEKMGKRLAHVHLCDGTGASVDEHLIPGHGTQPGKEICQQLARSHFNGHVIIEVSTNNAKNPAARRAMLAESCEFARTHLHANGRFPVQSSPHNQK